MMGLRCLLPEVGFSLGWTSHHLLPPHSEPVRLVLLSELVRIYLGRMKREAFPLVPS